MNLFNNSSISTPKKVLLNYNNDSSIVFNKNDPKNTLKQLNL
jgi:hypothetical protein